MQADSAPWVYDFRYNYYENFYRNRQKEFSSSANFYDMFNDSWSPNDNLMAVDDGLGVGSVVVNNGLSIKWYVQKHYNGDSPNCLATVIGEVMQDALDKYLDPIGSVKEAINIISDFVGDLTKSFICTATVNVLGNKCAKGFLDILMDYRDEVMTDDEGVAMLLYYGKLGPVLVRKMSEDEDSEAVYAYVFEEYLVRLPGLIDLGNKKEVIRIYIKLLDDMANRYDVPLSKGFKAWQQLS